LKGVTMATVTPVNCSPRMADMRTSRVTDRRKVTNRSQRRHPIP
jgi:hypothetical protein